MKNAKNEGKCVEGKRKCMRIADKKEWWIYHGCRAEARGWGR
jgi:hypothetical protein